MKASTFEAVLAANREKRPLAVVTRLSDGVQTLVNRDGAVGELALSEAELTQTRERMRDDKSGMLGDSGLFAHVHNPPARLIVIGAVHTTQALAPMAAIAGYEVVVVDPRASFLTEERFPGVTLMDDWPDEAMEELAPDIRTAVVTLTHDPKLDDPALSVALKSEAFYVACLGSRRTHAARVGRLQEMGFDDQAIGRIHGPAGLDIGSTSPAEIALSIMAELTAVKHGRDPAAAVAA
ncbi:MAG: XdhC family protein [Rhodospirillaceae bacterium]|jgi:xanthine dehydrogenase accessory factor|nr:XdhC family protein [Rhodospirillaceae bacterium]